MSSDSSPLVPYFAAPTFTRPTSVLFGGLSRVALNHLALECASRINDSFLWLEVRPPGVVTDPSEPSRIGRIPSRRRLEAIPPESPSAASGRVGRFVVRRAERPHEELGQIADVLRIPHFVRSLFPGPNSGSRPQVLVVANGDGILHIYPDSLEQARSFLRVFQQEKVTLVVSYCGEAPQSRFAFDYVFEVSTPEASRWKESTVRCEQSPKSAPFPAGSPFPAFGSR
ncbi:MAG: hypothetical protein WAN87_10260 [Thermoplasmata archaeon]